MKELEQAHCRKNRPLEIAHPAHHHLSELKNLQRANFNLIIICLMCKKYPHLNLTKRLKKNQEIEFQFLFHVIRVRQKIVISMTRKNLINLQNLLVNLQNFLAQKSCHQRYKIRVTTTFEINLVILKIQTVQTCRNKNTSNIFRKVIDQVILHTQEHITSLIT